MGIPLSSRMSTKGMAHRVRRLVKALLGSELLRRLYREEVWSMAQQKTTTLSSLLPGATQLWLGRPQASSFAQPRRPALPLPAACARVRFCLLTPCEAFHYSATAYSPARHTGLSRKERVGHQYDGALQPLSGVLAPTRWSISIRERRTRPRNGSIAGGRVASCSQTMSRWGTSRFLHTLSTRLRLVCYRANISWRTRSDR